MNKKSFAVAASIIILMALAVTVFTSKNQRIRFKNEIQRRDEKVIKKQKDEMKEKNFVQGEVIVKFKPGTNDTDVEKAKKAIGARSVEKIGSRIDNKGSLYLIKFDKKIKTEDAIAKLKSLDFVSIVEPNYIRELM